MNLINVIKNIGIVNICNEDELMLLLPNFPKLFGNVFYLFSFLIISVVLIFFIYRKQNNLV